MLSGNDVGKLWISYCSRRWSWPGDWIVANGKWVDHKTFLCMIQHSLFLFTGLNQGIVKTSGIVEAWDGKKLCLKCLPTEMCEGEISFIKTIEIGGFMCYTSIQHVTNGVTQWCYSTMVGIKLL